HAERVVDAHVPNVRASEHAVIAGEAEAPVPLLADGLDDVGAVGDRDELAPDEQPWGEHGRDAERGEGREPVLELLALGLVVGLVVLAVPEPDEAVGGEEVDGNEDDAADEKGNADSEVDGAPVRCERREVSGARKVEDEGSDDQEDDDDG